MIRTHSSNDIGSVHWLSDLRLVMLVVAGYNAKAHGVLSMSGDSYVALV